MSEKSTWEVPVYTYQMVEVEAESESEARTKGILEADRDDGEPFTEKPKKTEKADETNGESDA